MPSLEFAQRFDLRQLPGSLDLVELNGARATMTYRAVSPWREHLLFIHRDLVAAYAGLRRVVRVAWGEREVTVDWNSAPGWLREVHQGHLNLWRHVEVLEIL